MTSQIDFTQILQPFFANWPWFLGLFILLLLAKFLGSAGFKGCFGERLVSKSLSSLDPETYQTFHDLYFPRPDGQGTTQLDHVVVSPFGIFVVETKNYRGWIFGSEKQRQWTQQIYKRKERFQNPLHQNHLHIRALMAFSTFRNPHSIRSYSSSATANSKPQCRPTCSTGGYALGSKPVAIPSSTQTKSPGSALPRQTRTPHRPQSRRPPAPQGYDS
jgi:hypothetical protein